ncbi:endonuclease domain-containing protein [Sphingomonas sp. Sphisp140]|uniref:endonuclease domain-containing protein n=1 Tax=unclassified Sphingomonas TaxID=196159 RepID=UPI0039AE99D7
MELKGWSGGKRAAKRLRREMTLPEVLLWQELRKVPGVRFRRQYPAGPYVLDFYGARARLCVEVDGEIHGRGDQPARDAAREAWLVELGVGVLRVPAAEVLRDLDAVLRHILDVVSGR